MNHQQILIFGASGGCGRWATRLAAARGHNVTAVIRPESTYEAPDGVTVAKGQVTDPAFVKSILTEHRLIVSCMGLRRAGKSPFAKLLSPPDLVEQATRNIIEGAADPANTRLIWISAGGVGSSKEQLTRPVKKLIRTGNVAVAYRDLENAERLLAESELNALAVRAVTLLPGKPTGKAGPVHRYGLLSMIRRSDVAQWMIDIADGSQTTDSAHTLLGRSH